MILYQMSTRQLMLCCVVFDSLVVLKMHNSKSADLFSSSRLTSSSRPTSSSRLTSSWRQKRIKYRRTFYTFFIFSSTKTLLFFRLTTLIDSALLLALTILSWGLVLHLHGLQAWTVLSCLWPLLLVLLLSSAGTWYNFQVLNLGHFLIFELEIDNFW